jgi:ABC-type bacteriocin transporter
VTEPTAPSSEARSGPPKRRRRRLALWWPFRRYAHVPQDDQTDCGPAVLATIAKHYKIALSKAKLREIAGTDLQGTNLLGLSQAAERAGFETLGATAQWQTLFGRITFPMVAHVVTERGTGHFVTLYEVDDEGVLLADPAGGVERWTKEKFLERWLIHRLPHRGEERFGALLLLAPKPELYQNQEVAKASPWIWIWQLLKPRLPIVFEAFLSALLATLLALGSSFFIQVLVDHVLIRDKLSLLNLLTLGMLAVFLFRTAFGALRQYFLVHLAQKIDLELALHYFSHVLSLPVRFFQTRQVGEILSRMTDAGRVRVMIQGTALGLALDLFMFLLAAVVMLYYNAKLTGLLFLAMPLFPIAMTLLSFPIKKVERKKLELAADLSGHLVESFSGVATLKAFSAERGARRETEKKMLRMLKSQFRGDMLALLTGTIGGGLASLISLFVLWYGGRQVMGGTLSLGQLMFFNSLLGYLLTPMQNLSGVIVSVQESLVALDRLSENLTISPEQKPGFKGFRPARTAGEFRVEGVVFGYGKRAAVLKGIDLHVPAGSTVALVGESGSGKTTLANLLARYDEPQQGRILLDGVDLRDWDVYALRKAIGVVPQDVFLFRGQVRDNVALGAPDADLEQIMRACQAATAHDFISRMPERYSSLIGERGADLSGGQRQRLALARALLQDPPILILDEATSNLDSETEQAIQRTLNEVKQGRTTLIIAHRLSTVMGADQIVVLSDGEIVEQGDHDSLMAKRGRYYGMWERQVPDEVRATFAADALADLHAVSAGVD